jgi:hypothetical protein
MSGIIYVSHSQLDLWLHCPRKWEFKYIKRIQTPPTAPLIEGSCYHKVLETYFNHKLTTRQDMPLSDVNDAIATHWNTVAAPSNHINWEQHDPEDVRMECQALLTEYVSTIAPQITPVNVEETYISDIDGVKFVCVIDLITSDSAVVDHKTSAKKYSQDDVDKDIQATAEAFVLDKAIVFQNHVAVKDGAWIQIVKSYRTDVDIKWWLDMTKGIIKQMNSGIAPPRAMKGDYLCSQKFCGYWNMCRAGLARSIR